MPGPSARPLGIWTDARIALARELMPREDLTVEDVLRALNKLPGVKISNANAVRTRCSQLGIRRSAPRDPAVEARVDAAIRELRATGAADTAIAAALGMPRETVRDRGARIEARRNTGPGATPTGARPAGAAGPVPRDHAGTGTAPDAALPVDGANRNRVPIQGATLMPLGGGAPAGGVPIRAAKACQWPLWPDADRPPRPPLFCGSPCARDSYCTEHATLARTRYAPGYATSGQMKRLAEAVA